VIDIKGKSVRPRLEGWELWTLYRLLDHEYWLKRRRGVTDDDKEYFANLSRLRKKLLKNLNACRTERHQISIKEKVGY